MKSVAAIAALFAAVACGGPSGADDAAGATPAGFAVRGRWAEPRQIRYRVELEGAPIGGEAFANAIDRAAAVWSAAEVVDLRRAAAEEVASVTLGFRRGHHGACQPFGPSSDVAHTGPTAPGTFVHFDGARSWSENGEAGVSVFHTALHEFGHVLGLGHSEAPDAVMSTDPTRAAVLSWHDLAGLHSLYGGGRDSDGDLRIVGAGGAGGVVLRAVAPPGCCAFAVFDCDGDGNDEVLVWRTDPAGHGALLAFGFGPGPRLLRTVGPMYGAVAPGARVGFVVGPAKERLLVCAFANTPSIVRQFDHFGAPELPSAPFADSVLSAATCPARGDLDGDGASEQVVRAAPR